jgi:C-terminal processing protease CtpA/Prc
VAAIAAKDGRATVKGIVPGDKLLQVGDVELSSATWGRVFEAMHGSPGESRTLVVERDGVRVKVVAPVTRF